MHRPSFAVAKLSLLAVGLLILFVQLAPYATAAERPRKIVLLAGPITGHPKEAHEYEKNVILLKHLLDTSPSLRGQIQVEAHFKGWPANPETLDDADTILITSDGCDRQETDHPFYVGDRLETIAKQMRRGCGLVQFHWSTFNPARFHERITEWTGGYFDYETGPAPRKWYPAIQTWRATAFPARPDHPIVRGVRPYTAEEEFYYRMRFRESDPRLVSILETQPPNETHRFAVGWAVERADGGRGFGFTGGHFYQNWWNEDFRKLVLNAITWTARLEVPNGGIETEPFARFKALIVTGYQHPAHDWRAVTAALIPAIEQDPRAIVHVTENIEDLATDKINGYQLLVLNYCNWDRPGLSAAAKTNFTRYLNGGGGLAVIHFANGAFNETLPNAESDWPEFRTRIVRRVWDHRSGRSGHDPFGSFRVEISNQPHAITAGLAPFDTVDELYYRQAGELPIEPLAYAVSKQTAQREPMAWAYDYGRGRVFQTVLGHSDQSVRKAAALIRRGAVWAAGRNQISFDPPGELTAGMLFRAGSPWTPEDSARSTPGAPNKPAAPGPGTPKGSTPEPKPAAAKPQARILPPNTGLDEGGKYGHWGPTGEKDWVDDRWNRTQDGPVFSSSLQTPAGLALKSIAIRVGDTPAGGFCFDTAQLNLKAGWIGGFIRKSPARYGVIEMPKIDGDIVFASADGPVWGAAPTEYGGFHLHGPRTVLSYQVAGMKVLDSPGMEGANGSFFLTRTLQLSPSREPAQLTLIGFKPADKVRLESSGPPTVLIETGKRVIALRQAGTASASVLELVAEGSRIVARFPPHDRSVRVKLAIWSGSPDRLEEFLNSTSQSAPAEDLEILAAPGPARWTHTLETRGIRGQSTGPLAIDTLAVPYDNPYRALMFLSGHDFFDNGDAAVCTLHGDVWRVSGIDDRLDRLVWKRIATGLFQPLGLKIVNDRVHVIGRDQITRLHDENGDAEIDRYEAFHRDIKTLPGGHDYVTCLEQDEAGNFYYVDPLGIHRVAADGKTSVTLATGWRNPNGLGVGPGPIITVSPQEGEWTPGSHISEVKRGGYYGYGGPKVSAERPLGYDAPLCWVPRHLDNSSGGQVWVPTGRWGPLGGQMLHLSYGRCEMMLVLRDTAGGVAQGAVVPLKGRFLSGVMRGAFRSQDGNLYLTGLRGWTTSALRDGCFQRVRFTGAKWGLPVSFNVHANGLRLKFSEPLDRELAQDADSYAIEQWNYRYSAEYGSKEYSVMKPDVVGHDPVEIRSASLLEDGRTVFLETDPLRPVMQFQLRHNLEDKEGAPIRGQLIATINQCGPKFEPARSEAGRVAR